MVKWRWPEGSRGRRGFYELRGDGRRVWRVYASAGRLSDMPRQAMESSRRLCRPGHVFGAVWPVVTAWPRWCHGAHASKRCLVPSPSYPGSSWPLKHEHWALVWQWSGSNSWQEKVFDMTQGHHSALIGMVLRQGRSITRVSSLAKNEHKTTSVWGTSFVILLTDQIWKLESWGEMAT
jgi:hypothetical protein